MEQLPVLPWQRKHNKELYYILKLALVTSFIKSQRIRWLGHMRREEAITVRAELVEWKTHGKGKT